MTDRADTLPYRQCAGIMLLNGAGLVFVGQRLDSRSEAWQMPQGGIDKDETAEAAALRELREETGIAADLVTIAAKSSRFHDYDLPDHLIDRMWNGRYRGQRQTWFLLRFHGTDADVNIATRHQEFRAWKWTPVDTLVDLIVPFKKELYADVIAEFSGHF
jgi:putative (di)nucleoside polyphosphate hydrolase